MPKQTRWEMKRIAEQAINDLERAQGNLANLAVIYADAHPDIAEVWRCCFDALEPVKAVIQRQQGEL
jgi:hypothetical protein